ncbi:hypothetical protein MPTK1_2g21350 [Marchantia polymorpha subsp. ruderalis]|nr:hypothetical protein MARPO_0040s0079 [Marchantia polymorpha]BBN03170.1 hypothetical protein Mp_2g21350 [Marchantia polymorpha subsp. ruderalis]|eukprot:PTQ40406.1 hypothetical protein MARPO_0040s0079 [Marchantia polymorpha]
MTKRWTLIERMWPRAFAPSATGAPPLVAVLNNELFAINILENRLMIYEKDLNLWHLLEAIPERGQNVSGWGLGFKAVGSELFVIVSHTRERAECKRMGSRFQSSRVRAFCDRRRARYRR